MPLIIQQFGVKPSVKHGQAKLTPTGQVKPTPTAHRDPDERVQNVFDFCLWQIWMYYGNRWHKWSCPRSRDDAARDVAAIKLAHGPVGTPVMRLPVDQIPEQ